MDATAIRQAQQLLNNKDPELDHFAVLSYKDFLDMIQRLEEGKSRGKKDSKGGHKGGKGGKGSKDRRPTSLVGLVKPLDLTDDQLREIMNQFEEDIKKGLGKDTHEDAVVKCYLTYIQDLPTGKESGRYLALDLGGANFRVIVINISRKHFDMKSKVYAVPHSLMVGSGEKLFDHIAECLFRFCNEHELVEEYLPLGFTFSFPLVQEGLSGGVLQRWAKGFNCPDVIGMDVVKLLQEALERRGDLHIEVCAILNDSTGTLLSCAWKNKNTKIGLILGTGSNSCYVEKLENVERYEGDITKPYMLISTENGAFGEDGTLDVYRTKWDKQVDKTSESPGLFIYEKMIAGMYIGELARLILVEAAANKLIFKGVAKEALKMKGSFPAKYITDVESDKPESFTNAKVVLKDLGYPNPTDQDCTDLRFVCEAVSMRAANMVAATTASLLNRMDFDTVTIACDGSIFRFHPGFQDRIYNKIRDLLDSDIKFNLMLSEDGSGRGAALAAAVAATQTKEEVAQDNTIKLTDLLF
ncbi:hexokinase type 2 [Anabrus simplex]|uniref:hexokinase type 2 n=1 Tax=Anabrus simplex TaxID=316456 RepID=UPI0035A3C81B